MRHHSAHQSLIEIADALGITPAILRSWLINLHLDHSAYLPEERIYSTLWFEFFTQVAQLRQAGHSFSRIRAHMLPTLPPADSLLPLEHLRSKPKTTKPTKRRRKTKTQTEEPASIFEPPQAETDRVLRPDTDADDLGVYGPIAPQGFGFGSRQTLLPAVTEMGALTLQQDLSKMAQSYLQLMEKFQQLTSRLGETHYRLGQLETQNQHLEKQLDEKTAYFERQENQQHNRIQDLESQIKQLTQAFTEREDRFNQQLQQQVSQLTEVITLQQESLAKKQAEPQGFWSRWRHAKNVRHKP